MIPDDDLRIAAVRPLGYVEDYPVVCRIGDRALYLGNALAADPAQHDQRFEYVLSPTREERPLTTHHHPLDDGPDNAWHDFEAAVDTARELSREDGSLLIHCKAGISRSSTLVATAHPALVESVVVYLAAHVAPDR